jgi:hypothetical protein
VEFAPVTPKDKARPGNIPLNPDLPNRNAKGGREPEIVLDRDYTMRWVTYSDRLDKKVRDNIEKTVRNNHGISLRVLFGYENLSGSPDILSYYLRCFTLLNERLPQSRKHVVP